ncbi:hypothetical protein Scep_001530 [Stephania cephalantha]|uniref:Uncharacterized protein n=1 Tax=Stephania cephalantha TaxID=152367 RepID=A0AAP0LBX7_9MAGN
MRNRASKRPKTQASVFAVSPLGVNTPNNTTLVQSQQHMSKLSHHVPPPPPTHLHLHHIHTQHTCKHKTQTQTQTIGRERERRKGEEEEKKLCAGKESEEITIEEPRKSAERAKTRFGVTGGQ